MLDKHQSLLDSSFGDKISCSNSKIGSWTGNHMAASFGAVSHLWGEDGVHQRFLNVVKLIQVDQGRANAKRDIWNLHCPVSGGDFEACLDRCFKNSL